MTLPPVKAPGAPMSSSDRVHVESGRLGIIVTAIPGALTSIGIRPVAISTESQTSVGGISSGVPAPLRLVMSASPTR